MSKILALEWDDREIRAVLASPQGTDLYVEQIQRIPVNRSGDSGPTTRDFTTALSTAVSDHGWRKLRTLVAVGRSSCELKELSLPPVPDDELPELVRFQAMREFNNLSENSPFDYIPVPGDPEQPRTVLAAALAPATHKAIGEIVSGAGLQLDQIVLRPCASATLVNDRLPETFHVRLFVDVLATEIDLTVLAGTTPELMRTARLGGEHSGADAQRTILNEIRRTLAAASNSLHGRRIEKIVLCGDGPYQTQLAELLERELKLSIVLFDPLDKMSLSARLKDNLPAEYSHFAPHLGLLLGATGNRAPLLDFEHPHRKPEVPDQKRTYSLAGALAVVVMLALGYWVMSGLWELDAQIAAANKQITTLNSQKKAQEDSRKQNLQIDNWLVSDIPVVQELRAISEKLPDSKKIVVRKIQYTAEKKGGSFTLTGNAANRAAYDELALKLSTLNDSVTASPETTPASPGAKSTSTKTTDSQSTNPKNTASNSSDSKDSETSTSLNKESDRGASAKERKTAPENTAPAAKSPPTNTAPKNATPAKAAPGKKPVKEYRVVLGGSDDDSKNPKYPIAFTVKIYVDNPSPLTATLGPPPDEQNPRFIPPRVPTPTAAPPQKPAAPAPTTPVDAAKAEV